MVEPFYALPFPDETSARVAADRVRGAHVMRVDGAWLVLIPVDADAEDAEGA